MVKDQKEIDERQKAELYNADENVVLKTLKHIGEEGSRNMVEPVLELLANTNSEKVQSVIIAQLSELKIGEVETLFIEKLQKPEFYQLRRQLVSCMWNSGLNPTEHLHVLANIACEGDFMTALEVLTLIENMEGPFNHESLTDAFSEVSVYVNEAAADDPKLDLMKSIYGILYAFQEQ